MPRAKQAGLAWLGIALTSAIASAQSGSAPSVETPPATAATKQIAAGRAASTALPSGHPDLTGGVIPARALPDEDDDEDGALPSEQTAQPSQPTARGGTPDSAPFTPPSDTEIDAPDLPAGTIEIRLRTADDAPVRRTEITLGILHQSVAKGENREHRSATTDDSGNVILAGLETGSGVAYRVSVLLDRATFAALPFQLSPPRGKRVTLHIYEATTSLDHALIVVQAMLFAEVKDDRIQLEERLSIFNVGKVAWVPDDVIFRLPETFTALTSPQSMTDQGVDSIDKMGGRIHGTFPPGKHDLQFRWQLPYSGQSDVAFDVGLPPHVAFVRVLAAAARKARLSVDGFPEAQSRSDPQGSRVLLTERQASRAQPLSTIHVALQGLPTPGPGRLLATALASLGILAGLGFAIARTPLRPKKTGLRTFLLSEIADLEAARDRHDIGPKTYALARSSLIDALARTFDSSPRAPDT
jgi:hypothetical protein